MKTYLNIILSLMFALSLCNEAQAQLTFDSAGNMAKSAPCPSTSNCFIEKDTPGCDCAICETIICNTDPFCCSVEWDNICVNKAMESCWSKAHIEGEITQGLEFDGAVKAGAHISGASGTITRSFNNLPGGTPITVSRTQAGSYILSFGADVSGRYYQCTIGMADSTAGFSPGSIAVYPNPDNNGNLNVKSYSVSGGLMDNPFFILVY